MQPDLLAATEDDLRAEIRRHGGGTPPRFIAPDEDGDESGMVAIEVVPLERLVEYAEKRGLL